MDYGGDRSKPTPSTMKPLCQLCFSIQRQLLPALVEEIGPLSDLHKRFVSICEVADLSALMSPLGWVGFGRKPSPRLRLAYAMLAKALWKLPTTRALIDRLRCDATLRRLCGWENGPHEVPTESTFSRAFYSFAKLQIGTEAHKKLISKHLGDEIVWTCSSDGTNIDARERPVTQEKAPAQAQAQAKAKAKAKGKRGRPPKGSPPTPPPDPTRLERHLGNSLTTNILDMPAVVCSHGCKKNAKGHTEHWIGYKFHLSTGDGDIPLAAYLSSASLHDSQAAIILQQSVAERTKVVLYHLMDAAYDAAAIKTHSQLVGSVPIIDANKRGGTLPPPMEPDRARLYKARSGAERVNSNLKDNYGGRFVRVRGPMKVMAHLMFGVLAMTAEALARLP
jgi:hypothetical protein